MRFAFITPRFGADIGGGAEHACRLLAEQVSTRHDVDVLTTCARDPSTWRNEYAEGTDRVRGVLVRRFAVSQPHEHDGFVQLSKQLLSAPRSRRDEVGWAKRLGPASSGLQEYLKRQYRSYDALVFFSLRHATTVDGVQAFPERSIIFPYLQPRPTLRFGLWADMLASVKAVGFVSEAERHLMNGYVRAVPQAEEVVGIGIDPPPS